MFGYIIANPKTLNEEQTARYKSFYCGLCDALSQRHGFPCRATLNYDMTFLILLLSSLQKEYTPPGEGNCPKHPFKKPCCRQNRFSAYAADMNVLLAYYQQLDTWEDDRKAYARVSTGILKSKAEKVMEDYPLQGESIVKNLKLLAEMEKQGETNPDAPANCFGRLMGDLFKFGSIEENMLQAFGESLGRFIYLMDAACDLKKDIRKEKYNPLMTIPSDKHRAMLELLLAECTVRFDALPILRDRDIMENILYSGVWTRFQATRPKGGAAQQ